MIVKCDNCEQHINTATDRHMQMGSSANWTTFYICQTCTPIIKRELARQQTSAAKRRVTAGARA